MHCTDGESTWSSLQRYRCTYSCFQWALPLPNRRWRWYPPWQREWWTSWSTLVSSHSWQQFLFHSSRYHRQLQELILETRKKNTTDYSSRQQRGTPFSFLCNTPIQRHIPDKTPTAEDHGRCRSHNAEETGIARVVCSTRHFQNRRKKTTSKPTFTRANTSHFVIVSQRTRTGVGDQVSCRCTPSKPSAKKMAQRLMTSFHIISIAT